MTIANQEVEQFSAAVESETIQTKLDLYKTLTDRKARKELAAEITGLMSDYNEQVGSLIYNEKYFS